MKPSARIDRWVRRILPRGTLGEHILGDLREQYSRRAGRGGGGAWSRLVAAVLMLGSACEVRIRLGRHGGGDPAGRSGRKSGALRRLLDLGAHDARRGLRGLLRRPGYAATAMVTMGLGLAAFTTVFSVLHAVLLAPPPFEAPEELVALRVEETTGGAAPSSESYLLSFPQYLDIRARNRALEDVAAWTTDQPVLELGDGSPPLRIQASAVTGSFFELLGLTSSLGRTIDESDQSGSSGRVVMLSHGLWTTHFGADPDILGRGLPINGEAFVVVGVLSPEFTGLPDIGSGSLPSSDTDVWVAYGSSYLSSGRDLRGLHNISAIARMADGVDAATAAGDLGRVSRELAAEYEEHVDERAIAIPVQELVAGDATGPVRLIFAACTVVLLLALLNVAALTVSRASERTGEMAVRRALGGGRLAQVRVLVSEAAWLALGGVACGFAFSRLLLLGARTAEAGLIPRLANASVGTASLAVLGACAVLGTLVAGLLPALASDGDSTRLRSSTTRGATGTGQRLRSGLVAGQVAGTVVLLASTGLLLRSLGELGRVDPGYDPSDILLVQIRHPTPFVSPEWPQHVEFFRNLTDQVAGLSGVESVAVAYQPPTSPGWSNGFTFADRPPPPAGEGPSAIFRPIGPGYFETIGARLSQGRSIEFTDDVDTQPVAVVNEAFVGAFFEPGSPAVGTRLDYGSFWRRDFDLVEIVGVVSDIGFNGPEQATSPAIYFPHTQQPVHEMTLVVRTRGEPSALAEPIGQVVAALRPGLPVDAVRTLSDELAARQGVRRFLAVVLGTLAALAIALALVGLYGVLAHSVELRRREIGIRLAVGADTQRVMTSILGGSARLVGVGLLGGFVLALGATRVLQRFMFGVTALDPATWAMAALALAALALGVSALPARRAARIEPMQTLRGDG